MYVTVKLDAGGVSVTLNVKQKMLQALELGFSWVLHKFGELANSKGEPYECVHQVNQRSDRRSILKTKLYTSRGIGCTLCVW